MTTGTMVLQASAQWLDRLLALLPGRKPADNDLPKLRRIARREIAEIDMLFIKLGIDAWVDRRHITGSATGGFIRYPVLTGGKVSALAGIDRDLCVLFTKERGQRITSAGVVFPEQWIELPYPLARRPLPWAKANLDELRKFQALIGVDHSGNSAKPVVLDYNDDTVSHALLSGTTGSGKSTELAAVILSLAYSTSPADAKIVIVDPKISMHIAPLAGLPHVSLFNDLQGCLDAIASVKAAKDKRRGKRPRQRVFLFVEEFAELDSEAGPADLIGPLRSVVGTGRESGVHVVACTQKATVDVIDTVLKANLPTRIAGKVTTAKESEVATGVTGAGAERLPGRGAFLFSNGGDLQRVQGYYLTPDEIAGAVNQIAARWHNVKPYSIDWIESPPAVGPADELDAHIAKVLDAWELADLVDADGPKWGAKSKVAETLFNARYAGNNRAAVDAVLGRIANSTSTDN